MPLHILTVPSAVENYLCEYTRHKEFAESTDKTITVMYYDARMGKDYYLKVQPSHPAAQQIRDAIRTINEERMAACRQEDIKYRLDLAEHAIKKLKESIKGDE